MQRVMHFSMDKQWAAHVKDESSGGEVSVCYGLPEASWGWFGREKIRMEGGDLEEQRTRAEKIAAALNAASFDPGLSPTQTTCAHGYTICAPCKFPSPMV